MSLLERVFFFHQEIERNRFPNSRTLTEQFEVSVATARRDIAYLRDRLLAPLAFDSKRNGFYYHEQGFQLPFGDNPRIIFLMAMLNKMAAEAGLQGLTEITQLEQRLASMIAPEYLDVVKNLHVERIEIESVDSQIFATITEGLGRNHYLEIQYQAVGEQLGGRKIAPRQLLNYQGRWYLFAHCTLRRDYRLFHVGRMKKVKLTAEPIPADLFTKHADHFESFGIFTGKPRFQASILFTGTAVELVRAQRWHKNQKLTETSEGLFLELPVSDDRELVMKILQYGRMATVVNPPELAFRIQNEIKAMQKNYR